MRSVRRLLSFSLMIVATAAASAFLSAAAQAQQPALPLQVQSAPVTAVLLAEGFEVKAVVNNAYLILQKANKTYWCGTPDPALTWANWPVMTREAQCVQMSR